jgi:O-antigen/teichoic acid export membrane protein
MDIKQRLIINSLYNVAGRGFSMLIGFFLIPFMVGKLGTERYAIIPVVMYSIIPFLEIFTSGIATSVGRYVTFHQARHEIEEANRYFNTSFFMLLSMCALATLPILGLSYYFPEIFGAAQGRETNSQWTMLLAGVAFLITGVSGTFGVGMYYRERFGLRNLFYVAGLLARAGTIVLLFNLVGPNAAYVALGMVAAAVIQGVANWATAYRMLPGLRTSWRFFSREKMKDVFGFSFYLLISRISFLLFVRTDYLLINWLIAKKEVTVYSLGAYWALLLRGLAETAVYALGPLVTTLFATGQHARIRRIFLRGTRVMCLVFSPICIFLCVLGVPFMTAWVGRVKGMHPALLREAVWVLWVMVLPLVLNLSVTPAFPMFVSTGHVRVVAFVTLAAAVANIVLSIWLAIGLHLGILGIALGSAICLTAKNAAFVPVYMCRLCNARLRDFFRVFPGPVAACLPGAAFGILIQYLTDINSWAGVILVGSACMVSYGLIVFFWCLSKEEKTELYTILSQVRGIFSREKKSKGE